MSGVLPAGLLNLGHRFIASALIVTSLGIGVTFAGGFWDFVQFQKVLLAKPKAPAPTAAGAEMK